MSWLDRCELKHFIDAKAKQQKLRKRGSQVERRPVGAPTGEVTADGIWQKALLQTFFGQIKSEMKGAVTNVEKNASLARLQHFRKYLSVRVYDAVGPRGKTVGDYIAWTQGLKNLAQR